MFLLSKRIAVELTLYLTGLIEIDTHGNFDPYIEIEMALVAAYLLSCTQKSHLKRIYPNRQKNRSQGSEVFLFTSTFQLTRETKASSPPQMNPFTSAEYIKHVSIAPQVNNRRCQQN